jgi:hypothetical protein
MMDLSKLPEVDLSAPSRHRIGEIRLQVWGALLRIYCRVRLSSPVAMRMRPKY